MDSLSCQYYVVGVSTRALFVDIQEHVHRRVMEIDFFAPWILTHGVIDGTTLCDCVDWEWDKWGWGIVLHVWGEGGGVMGGTVGMVG